MALKNSVVLVENHWLTAKYQGQAVFWLKQQPAVDAVRTSFQLQAGTLEV
jgi:hypothetical protein